MLEMEDSLAVITGANSGIGFWTAKRLVEAGCDVVLGCRSKEKGSRAAGRMEGETSVVELDLASKKKIENFAKEVSSQFSGIDILVNNAGVMNIPWKTTDFGFEYQFGVNHLGHFYLDSELLTELNTGARVVTLTSLAMKNGNLNFDELNDKYSYDSWQAYSDSKLANMVYALELQRRLEDAGREVSSHAAHPGMASTQLFRKGPEKRGNELKLLMMKIFVKLFAQTAENGSLPVLHAATAEIPGGTLSGPDGLFRARGKPEIQEPVKKAKNESRGDELWSFSEKVLESEFTIE